MICSNYWTCMKERLGWIFTSKYRMSKQLGWSERRVSKCMWFRFRHILMKIGFTYSLYRNILTSVSSFWISNHLLQTMAQKHLPVTDLNYLPTQLTAETVRVGLMHPLQLSAIHGAHIQSIPRWECKSRTEALALGSSHNSTTSTVSCSQEG